jgi:hypothetical protein
VIRVWRTRMLEEYQPLRAHPNLRDWIKRVDAHPRAF